MNAKFNDIWKNVKEVVIDFILEFPTILYDLLSTTILFVILQAIIGTVFSICWNVAMTNMFGFNKITIWQASILHYTIYSLITNYGSSITSSYKVCKEKIFSSFENENTEKFLAIIFFILLELLNVFVVMHSWNNIIPQILNVELTQINFGKAFVFSFLFKIFFGFYRADDKDSKKYKENKYEIIEDENNTKYIVAIDEDENKYIVGVVKSD